MIIIRKRKIIAGSLLLGLSDSKVLMLGGRIKNKGQENQIRIIARLPNDILYAAKRWQAANHLRAASTAAGWRYDASLQILGTKHLIAIAPSVGRRVAFLRCTIPIGAPGNQISICVPSSTTRLAGILKYSTALPAFRAIVANMRSRQKAMPLGRLATGITVSRLRKNEVCIMSNARP